MVVAINRVSRANNPESNNGRILLHGTFIGFVKNNVDIQMMGRLQVYIPEIGGDPTNPNDWILVSYASQFAGSTNPMNVKKGDNTMAGTQSSYGWWGVPPDLNNMVLITFVNGDLARGFWFACVWQQNMNQMVPGIASATTNDPSYPNGAPTVAISGWHFHTGLNGRCSAWSKYRVCSSRGRFQYIWIIVASWASNVRR
jgi:hypothetical protein